MKFVFKNYQFENDKIKEKIYFALFSDIHFSNKTNINELYQINENLKMKNLDYIFIPGDIVDDISYLYDDNRRNLYLDWFKSLGKITKTIISLGNHDFNTDGKELFKNDDFLIAINNLNNVYLLDNTYYEDERIHVFGFTSTHDEQKDINNTDQYIENLNKQNIKYTTGKNTILMCHSPQMITTEKIYKKISNFENIDLVLCGHMHNGMLLPFADNLFKGNWGLISPYKSLLPNCSRGVIKKNHNEKEITFVISGSICKLSASAKLLRILNKLYPASIEFITVVKR